jgi:hypothetical protein
VSHAIEQIRDALVSALTGLTTTGSRVYRSRLWPRTAASLPCLVVSTESESAELATLHPNPLLQRGLDVQVRGYALATTDLDETLDDIQAEVETALGNTTLGGLVKTLTYSGRQVALDDASDQPVGLLTLTFQAVYMTAASSPGTAV